MRMVILENREYRGVAACPVIGRTGFKYGSAFFDFKHRIYRHRMPFDEWKKYQWDIAQGGRRMGYTFYVSDIVEDNSVPTPEPAPEPEPPQPAPEAPPPPVTELAATDPKEMRAAELVAKTVKELHAIAKRKGIKVDKSATKAHIVAEIIVTEFP